jgi:hypothetical protein
MGGLVAYFSHKKRRSEKLLSLRVFQIYSTDRLTRLVLPGFFSNQLIRGLI